MRGHLSETQRQKQVIARLKNENATLREEVKRIPVLEEEIRRLKEELEKAFLLIEELQRMIFRKSKKKHNNDDNDNAGSHPEGSEPRKKADRDASSYRRENPKEEAVTSEELHHETTCSACQTELTALKDLEFFTEDIVPPEEWFKVLKKVTRHRITTGYCVPCHKRVSPIEIPKQKTSLGENIRQLIAFQFTVQQLSYSQIIDFSEGVLRLKLSQGEIAHILEDQAVKLEPEYLVLQENIRSSPVNHVDETGWPTAQGSQGNYGWAVCSEETDDVLYVLGQSRGKGNVEKILGKDYAGIGITDDYGVYKNFFLKGHHALCWAHPHRKIRDLKNSETLSEEKKEQCKKTFEEFSALYEKVREVHARPYVKKEREGDVKKLSQIFDRFIRPHPKDPKKLQQIKLRLGEQKDCYFVCLLEPGVSPDNNKAERALRHLVIKRKKSFGSKTQKGADMLSVIYSVVMSLWRKSKQDFFGAYRKALEPVGQ